MKPFDEASDGDEQIDTHVAQNETLQNSPDNQSEAEPKTDLGRRTMIGISVASIIELMLSGLFGRGVRARTTEGKPIAQAQQVKPMSSADTMAYVRKQLASNSTAQQLKREFEGQGYEFRLERARAYKVGSQTLAIIPSLMPAKRTDPSHSAVSISISDAGTVAGGAKIAHTPNFHISEFTFYYLSPEGKVASQVLTRDALSAKGTDEIAREISAPMTAMSEKAVSTDRMKMGAKRADLHTVIELFYRDTISDKYARPLYPAEGLRNMMAQTPLIQKFSEVNGMVYARQAGGAAARVTVLCTSTSSNACTSSSFIIN